MVYELAPSCGLKGILLFEGMWLEKAKCTMGSESCIPGCRGIGGNEKPIGVHWGRGVL